MKNIRLFSSEKFPKFSVYLNRHVFIMYYSFCVIYGCQTMLDKRVIMRGFFKKSIYDISRINFLFSL